MAKVNPIQDQVEDAEEAIAARKAGHSPRPWKLGQEYDNYRDEIEDADGRCVAVVWVRKPKPEGASSRACFLDEPELHANARLIAAAPELLAACKEVLYWLEAHTEQSTNVTKAVSAVRAAIAKAEGR